MFSRKILVLGSSGYVGSHIIKSLENRSVKHVGLNRKTAVDIFNPFSLSEFINDNKITELINCIGYTGKPNVDACEQNKTDCFLYNTVLPDRIGLACLLSNITWGHVSSGCIYDQYIDGGYTEEDEPNFCFGYKCSYYSGTKAMSEQLLRKFHNCYIWRLRIPFTNIDSDRNYISKLLSFKTLNNKQNSLSDLNEFSNACIDCIINKLPVGIYNLTNSDSISASEVIEMAKQIWNKNIEYDVSEPDILHSITPRSNCTLNNSKALKFGLKLSDVKKSIRTALENWSVN